jgi:hypothetical protein
MYLDSNSFSQQAFYFYYYETPEEFSLPLEDFDTNPVTFIIPEPSKCSVGTPIIHLKTSNFQYFHSNPYPPQKSPGIFYLVQQRLCI